MTEQSTLTANDNYYENFTVGDVYKHARGKTVTENDAVTICHLVMNSSPGHFNDHMVAQMHADGKAHVAESLVFGGVTISITIGLAHQDSGENVIREVSMTNLKLLAPVLHGDTLYAYSEVLAKQDSDEGAGLVTFRHYGVNEKNTIVFQGDRTALVHKSPH